MICLRCFPCSHGSLVVTTAHGVEEDINVCAHVQFLVSMHVFVCACLHVCTSGLATADVTGRDPVVRECVDDPVQLVPVAVLDKTVPCRHQQLN